MSKSKLNIELDRSEIKPDKIPEAPLDEIYDGIGFERDPDNFEFISKRKRAKKKEEGSLNIRDGLRLGERFINKYLGWLIGNNPNPIPQVRMIKWHLIYFAAITILIILLIIK